MPITQDYVYFPGSATVEDVLRTYLDKEGQWWWLLVTDTDGEYSVCSFGSLLPYLTGRTPHIVHNIGDCPICCAMDPLLWSNTGALIEEALADAATRSRLVSDLPMAEMPGIDAKDKDESAILLWLIGQGLRAGVLTEDGVLSGVYTMQYMGVSGGLPDY